MSQCTSPIHAIYLKDPSTGKGKIYIDGKNAPVREPWVRLPCGNCMKCRLEKSRQWAVRMMHEAQMHENNCYVTLTYNDDFLPENYGLNKRHLTLFLKKLRKKFSNLKIKHYAVGEYGDDDLRPHYHLILFGVDFHDKKFWKKIKGNNYYNSETLNKLWSCPETKESYGYAVISAATFDSAAYCARYITKKIRITDKTPEHLRNHYFRQHPYTGKTHEVEKEFAFMSKRPGIGKEWYDKYSKSVRDNDSIVVNGKEMQPPRYYDKLTEDLFEDEYTYIEEQRIKNANTPQAKARNTTSRLIARDAIVKAQANLYKRNMK